MSDETTWRRLVGPQDALLWWLLPRVGQRTQAGAVSALRWADGRYGAPEMRAVVQSWNERSLRLCHRLGFRVAGRHCVEQGGVMVEYVVSRRPAGRSATAASECR